MTKLDKDEMFDAVRLGVKEAILEMTDSGNGVWAPIRTEEFMEQIRKGVSDAIWRLATNATQMPCHDFYDMIKEGMKEAVSNMDFNGRN